MMDEVKEGTGREKSCTQEHKEEERKMQNHRGSALRVCSRNGRGNITVTLLSFYFFCQC